MVASAEFSVSGADIANPPSTKALRNTIPDYQAMFSQEACKRIMPGLRRLAVEFANEPGMIPMNAGLPPTDAFPLDSIQINFKDGSNVTIDQGKEMLYAQQYNLNLKGHPKLLQWIERHLQEVHSPPGGHETLVTSGSNPSLDIIFRMFLNSGDPVLVEEYTYAHVPESMFEPHGIKTVPIKTDSHGIVPESLQEALAALQARGAQMPKLLYTVPVGQNPTGATTTLERKEKVYAICRRYDIIIMEDDPYFYLQYKAGAPPKGLKDLEPSYLSMDTDCRVIRFDSFSKVLIPGFRLGWLTAHPQVINKFIYHFHGIMMGPSSMSQVMMGAVLEKLGSEGFEAHLKGVQERYARRAGIIMAAAEKYLTGWAQWAPVTSGMFMWLNLTHVEDVSTILPDLQSAHVVVVPGTLTLHSYPNIGEAKSNGLRLSFVTAAEDKLEEGIMKIAAVLQKFSRGL